MMGEGSLILVGGGARSGKSRFALRRASELGARRVFVATAEPFDDEMKERIERHRTERGNLFRTLEAPIDLPRAMEGLTDVDVVVIDCLTIWLSNLLLKDYGEERVEHEVEALLARVRPRRFHTLVVTNEVGMGMVPPSRLGRLFRDVAGRAHQKLAEEADAIYLATLGTVLRLRPGPVEASRECRI